MVVVIQQKLTETNSEAIGRVGMEQVLRSHWNQNPSLCLLSLLFSEHCLFSLSQHTDFLHGRENMAEFYT